MLDEKLLLRVLPRPAQDTPAHAIDEILHLAQSAKYDLAAARAATLLEAGCKDVRAFVVYALGVFAERGPGSIPALFEPVTALLSNRSPGFSPTLAASRSTDTALRFCFRTMKAHLEFDERLTGTARHAWSQHFVGSSPALVLRACTELRAAIREAIETPCCDTELSSMLARIEAYCTRFTDPRPDASLRRDPAPEPKPAEILPPGVELAIALPPPLESEAPAPPPSFSRRAADYVVADERALTVSPALYQFMRKLEAFEQLVQGGSLAKAAVVAHDIRQVVADFDPMTYLPDLLSPHFRLLSRNVEQLSPYWEQCSSASWQALEQLYRVDLDGFIDT